MRKFVFVAPALFLAGCASAAPPSDSGPPQPTPIHGVTPGHKCRTDDTARFIGQSGTTTTGSEIKRVSRAAVLRWAPPGTMLTMDFREDRVTIYLDDARKITKITCG